jgi:hypothetical protein
LSLFVATKTASLMSIKGNLSSICIVVSFSIITGAFKIAGSNIQKLEFIL